MRVMYEGKSFDLVKTQKGEYVMQITDEGPALRVKSYVRIAEAEALYNATRELDDSSEVQKVFDEYLDSGRITNLMKSEDGEATKVDERSTEDKVTDGLKKLCSFFKEFDFEPNFRFVNTLSKNLTKGQNEAKQYVSNYFELTNSPYSKAINEKIKSREFKAILDLLGCATPTKSINNRFKLYYGSQGTGKTTLALKESNNKCMVCHSAILPSDLMEDFNFNDGKAEFQPSALYLAMENGEKIVLDEFNLLPFESLRFLQTILDGKKSFDYKGRTVNIKDGFQIIGTMNLTVNGMTYGLPEPLVDRASETVKFNLTAEDLLSAIF